jgi:capsular exopolysaccharide synthesis family protein
VSYIYEALQRVEEERKAAQTSAGGGLGLQTNSDNGHDTLRVLQELTLGSTPEVTDVAPVSQFERIEITDVPEDSRLVTVREASSLGAERFRVLATRLKNLQQKRPLKRLLITSSITQEGKSLVSSNLAITLSRHGLQRVLLVDGDLRKPVLCNRFGLSGKRGLSEFLSGNEPAERFIYELAPFHIHLLPAGSIPHNPLELIQSSKLPGLLTKMSTMFDWIVVDSPPLVPVADASVWGRLTDGTLLVARQGVTERRMLEKGLKPLDSPALLGVVFNDTNGTSHQYDYYSYDAHTPGKPAQTGSPKASV